MKSGATDVREDFKSVDWDNFFLTTYGVAGETTPYTNSRLHYMDEDTWGKFHKEDDIKAITSGNSEYNKPIRAIPSADKRYVGLSPVPDKVYRVYFNAWVIPTKLSVATDEFVIPDRWMNVLYARARYYMWQFKESPQQASFADQEYKYGIRQMRKNLIDSTPDDMQDDRVRF